MDTKKQTKPTVRTYLGREATCWDYLSAGPLGLRVVAIKWTDTGELHLRQIEGDGRKPATFKTHAEVVIPHGTIAQANVWVEGL